MAVALPGQSVAQQPTTNSPDSSPPSTPQQASPEDAPQQLPDSQEKPADPPKLPTLEEMELPSAAQLLQERPVTWIVLKQGDQVLVTEPITPRPRTLEAMQARMEASYKWPAPITTEEAEDQRARRFNLNFLYMVLPNDDRHPEYRLHRQHIREIIHHEDLMLRRAHRFIDEGKLREAFELLLVLQRRHPDWPGYRECHHRLLFEEARFNFQHGQAEAALVRLEELHKQDAQYTKLSDRLGQVTDQLIATAVDQGDYRQARHFLSRLAACEPRHALIGHWTDRLRAQATERMTRAIQASQEGRHDQAALLIDEASRTWPELPDLRTSYFRIADRFQRLEVGVVDLPGRSSAYFLPTDADRRQQSLTQMTLFEVESIDRTAHYQSRFFDLWEPTQLGRRTQFEMQRRSANWESRRPVTATTIVQSLADRLNPSHPAYDQRLASFMDSVVLQSPFQFTIHFTRAPLRLEALLATPILSTAPPSGSLPGTASTKPIERRLHKASQRFTIHQRDDQQIVYRRSVAQADGKTQYHIAEITERRYASYDKAVQGLLRGEVSLLPHLQSRDVAPLQADQRFSVRKYALPVTHLLQFNPASETLRNDELRRALAYAINRSAILKETVLNGADEDLGRLISGPFASQTSAYNMLVPPREHDPFLAASLAMAARRQLEGKLPKLKLLCSPDPIAQAAAKRLIDEWAAIGVTVQLVADQETASRNGERTDWDIVYRTLKMTEPLVDLWPTLTLSSEARIEDLAPLPDWLRQELIELEHAGDWDTATNTLHRLHEYLWADVQLIPLWEVDDFLVARRTIQGLVSRPVHTYQNVERWIVRPWYPTDSP